LKSKVFFLPASGAEAPESVAKKVGKIFLCLRLMESIEENSFVALKIHFGEKGNTGYIKPPWLAELIGHLKSCRARPFFVDTNTLYVGQRSNSVDHLNLAAEHGFSHDKTGIPSLIADGLIGRDDDEIAIDLPRVKSAKIASAILNSDVLVCLSHFTGHISTGVGAAIKNLGMGCASRSGKLEQHSNAFPRVNPEVCTNCGICLDYCPTGAIVQKEGSAFIVEEKCIGCGECLVVCNVGAVKHRWDQDCFRVQEKMAEYAFAVKKRFNKRIGFLNFVLTVTKDCDCMSKKGKIIADDVGILASADPVAVDKASADLVNRSSGTDVLRLANDVDWAVQLRHGEKIGLGSMEYDLVELN
jgi:uncharacterized Fe-S center protein